MLALPREPRGGAQRASSRQTACIPSVAAGIRHRRAIVSRQCPLHGRMRENTTTQHKDCAEFTRARSLAPSSAERFSADGFTAVAYARDNAGRQEMERLFDGNPPVVDFQPLQWAELARRVGTMNWCMGCIRRLNHVPPLGSSARATMMYLWPSASTIALSACHCRHDPDLR